MGAAQAAPPNPCRPFLFLLEEKEAKDYLGGYPLKTPRGSALAAPHAGRPPLSLRDISPALRGNRPHTPTAGFLSGNSKCSESTLAFLFGLLFPISALYQVRASRPSLRGLVRANCARSSAALWNYVPTLGLWGSSGSEMPSHFRKCARLRRALAVEQADHPGRSFQAISRRPVYFHGRQADLL